MKNALKALDSEKNIHKWISGIGSLDWSDRLNARSSLIRAGVNAVPALIQTLSNSNRHARWEAANALAFIKDSSAASALVHTLEDEDQYVRLAAMGALVALNREGLEPLLLALTQDFGSARLREGAHNILNILKNQKYLRRPCVHVLQALDGADP